MYTVRQKRFVSEYIKTGGNAYQAALNAGYADSTAKKASVWVNQTKPNAGVKYRPDLVEAIQAEAEALQEKAVADEREVLEYLTSVMRKEATTVQSVVDFKTGDTYQVERGPTEREALRAAEILIKLYKPDNMMVTVQKPVVVIEGYDDIND